MAHREGQAEAEVLGRLNRLFLLGRVAPPANPGGDPEIVPRLVVAQRGIGKDAVLLVVDLEVAIVGQEDFMSLTDCARQLESLPGRADIGEEGAAFAGEFADDHVAPANLVATGIRLAGRQPATGPIDALGPQEEVIREILEGRIGDRIRAGEIDVVDLVARRVR